MDLPTWQHIASEDTLPSSMQETLREIPLPKRRHLIESYLSDAGKNLEEIVGPLYEPSRPMAQTAVAIPVAIHQDGSRIETALKAYSTQKNAAPFTIFLHLNYPIEYANDPDTTAAIEQAYDLQRHYGDRLDVRISSAEYSTPKIGEIRKDLWTGIMGLAYAEGIFDDPKNDVITINNDIDTVSMSPYYISSIQEHYARQQRRRDQVYLSELTPSLGSTSVRHALPIQTHPRTAGGIAWIDSLQEKLWRTGESVGYEAGLVVPLSHYAKLGGFHPLSVTHETSSLVHHQSHPNVRPIPGSVLRTSPRRYIERFPEHGYAIWDNESFGATNTCRSVPPEHLRDASQDELDEHIDAILENSIVQLAVCALRSANQQIRSFPEQDLASAYESTFGRAIHAANRALHIIGSPKNAFLLPNTPEEQQALTRELLKQ